MSKTGRWKVIDGKVVKVSDEIPRIASRIDGVYFREPYMENFAGGGSRPGVMVTSKSHKKELMKNLNIEECEESLKEVPPETFGKTLYSIPKGQNQQKAKTP